MSGRVKKSGSAIRKRVGQGGRTVQYRSKVIQSSRTGSHLPCCPNRVSYRDVVPCGQNHVVATGCPSKEVKPCCPNRDVETKRSAQRSRNKEVCTKKSISQKGICRLTVRFRSAHPGISAPVPRGCGSRRCRCSCPCSRCFWRRDRDCRARSCRCSQSPWSDCRG